MPIKRKDKGRSSLEAKSIGNLGYITQPATNVSTVQGQIVISPYFPYKRRLY